MTPPDTQSPPPANDAGVRYRNLWGALAILVAVVLVELALLQLFAIGATTGIYHLAPQLDVGSPRGFRDWLTILQVVSATLTLPGGTAIVLSIWLASRWANQRADAAQQEAKKWQDAAVAAQASAASAESRISALETQLAAMQAQLERRGRRRRLRR